MPFDGVTQQSIGDVIEAAKRRRTSTSKLRALANILRHPDFLTDFWPQWNYSDRRYCAIGVAYSLWGHVPIDMAIDGMEIFHRDMGAVKYRPEQVAGFIDELLAKE